MSDDDDICRAQDLRSEAPCPRCGYVSATKPAWAEIGVTFGLGGKRYRIVAIGSTNGFAPRYLHFEDTVSCQPIDDEPWQLPDAPCPKADVGVALRGLFGLPTFRAKDLESAYFIEERP